MVPAVLLAGTYRTNMISSNPHNFYWGSYLKNISKKCFITKHSEIALFRLQLNAHIPERVLNIRDTFKYYFISQSGVNKPVLPKQEEKINHLESKESTS